MIVKAVLQNQPTCVAEDFEVAQMGVDTENMYQRALDQNLQYHQFIEWVQHDIGMQIFKDFDSLFLEADKRFLNHELTENDHFQDYVISDHNKDTFKLFPDSKQPNSARD